MPIKLIEGSDKRPYSFAWLRDRLGLEKLPEFGFVIEFPVKKHLHQTIPSKLRLRLYDAKMHAP
jgi:hypothetical protein